MEPVGEEGRGRKRGRGDELLEERERDLARRGLQQVATVDDKFVRRMLAALRKRADENTQARIKYADQPDQFMESELKLDEAIKDLQHLATSPEHYPSLIRHEGVPLLVSLLAHENTSVTRDCCLVLSELLDGDSVEDRLDEALELTESLVDNKLVGELEAVLRRCGNEAKDSEERECVFHTLTLLENMVDLKPEVAESVDDGAAEGGILGWLVGRVAGAESDSNRTYASEILAILLQSSDKNKKSFLRLEGVESLLQSIAKFRKVAPRDAEEEEYLENLFDCLCATAMLRESKEELLRTEALELMVVMMKKREKTRVQGMKVCSFALTDSRRLCEQFVSVDCLGPLFAFFMGKGLGKGVSAKKRKEVALEMQEHVISVLASLLQKLEAGPRRDRVLAKFTEEKLDRLVELWDEYAKRVGSLGGLADDPSGGEGEVAYLGLLDRGLYCLQQLALVAGCVWSSGVPGLQRRLLFVARQYGYELADFAAALKVQLRFSFDDNQRDGEGEAKTRLEKLVRILDP